MIYNCSVIINLFEMGYNEESQATIDKEDDKYEAMKQDSIDDYFNEQTGTNSDGYGEYSEEDDSGDEGYY